MEPFNFDPSYWSSEQDVPEQVPELKLSHDDQSKLAVRGYKLSPGKPLGKGGYGVVYRASHFEHACAVKMMDVAGLVRDYPFTWAWVHQELVLMKKVLKHPHIVQVYDLFITEQSQLLVFMELAEGGCLFDRIFKCTPRLTEDDARKYYRQFGSAFMYMHSLGFAHRDIKPENVLLDASKEVCKVTDFGLSNRAFDVATGLEHLSRPGLGTYRFCAPEVLAVHIYGRANCERYSEFKADVWSAGALLFMMLLQEFPFEPNPNYPFNQEDDKKYLYAQQISHKYCIYLSEHLSNEAIRMIHIHFVINPKKRPSFYELFQSEPWLNNV